MPTLSFVFLEQKSQCDPLKGIKLHPSKVSESLRQSRKAVLISRKLRGLLKGHSCCDLVITMFWVEQVILPWLPPFILSWYLCSHTQFTSVVKVLQLTVAHMPSVGTREGDRRRSVKERQTGSEIFCCFHLLVWVCDWAPCHHVSCEKY